MKNESQQSRKNQVRTSIKIILLVVVVGLVYLGIKVPIPHPVVVKSLFQEGETAVQVVPMAANAESGEAKELKISIRPRLTNGENTNR